MDRKLWVDLARGACMILVVMMHLDEMHYSVVMHASSFLGEWDVLTSAARPARMPLFFVVSGYLAASAVLRPWRQVVRNRVIRLVYLYVVWLVVYAGLALADPWGDPSLSPASVLAAYAGQLLWPDSSLWFIYALVLYFAVARALRDAPRAAVFGAAALLSAVSESLPSPTAAYLARCLLFFLIGAYAPATIDALAARAGAATAVAATLAYAAATGLILVAGGDVFGIWLPAGVAGVWLGVVLSVLAARTWLTAPLVAIGRRTVCIFVLHGVFITQLNRLAPLGGGWFPDLVTGSAALAALYPVAANAVVIAACLAVYEACRRCGLSWLFALPPWAFASLVPARSTAARPPAAAARPRDRAPGRALEPASTDP